MIGTVDEARTGKPGANGPPPPKTNSKSKPDTPIRAIQLKTTVPSLMHLKILLPTQVFAEKHEVSRVVAETHHGSFGLLPSRRERVAALAPGILTYGTPGDGEVFVAVDEAVLVKTGRQVLVSVRRAIGGTDLAELHLAVQQEFLTLDEQDQSVRSVMAKLEVGLLHRPTTFRHE